MMHVFTIFLGLSFEIPYHFSNKKRLFRRLWNDVGNVWLFCVTIISLETFLIHSFLATRHFSLAKESDVNAYRITSTWFTITLRNFESYELNPM